MAERAGSLMWSVAWWTCLLVVFVALGWSTAQAKEAAPIEGIRFDVAGSMQDNLKAFAGKDVTIQLRSGKTYQGYVKSVGNAFVHLEKLAGKDLYDAMIRIDDIAAMETKFRDLK